MSEDAAILATRWYQEVWVERSDDAIDRLAAHDCTSHQADGTTLTLGDWKRFRAGLFEGFPDLVVRVDGVVARGDDAVVRWRATGTHVGRVFGLVGTDREIEVHGMSWLRFRNGKIVEGWDGWNVGGLIESLSRPATDKPRSAS